MRVSIGRQALGLSIWFSRSIPSLFKLHLGYVSKVHPVVPSLIVQLKWSKHLYLAVLVLRTTMAYGSGIRSVSTDRTVPHGCHTAFLHSMVQSNHARLENDAHLQHIDTEHSCHLSEVLKKSLWLKSVDLSNTDLDTEERRWHFQLFSSAHLLLGMGSQGCNMYNIPSSCCKMCTGCQT